jgi:hypothetical protein
MSTRYATSLGFRRTTVVVTVRHVEQSQLRLRMIFASNVS